MNNRELVPTIAFVLLTCVAINACFYFVQINEHHRALTSASAGFRSRRALHLPLRNPVVAQGNEQDLDRLVKPASINASTEEEALVEVTRSLLMLPDEPEARAWRAREEAYRARLLAVALEGAALHHQFAMGRKLLGDRSQRTNPASQPTPTCHGDPGCLQLHATAMPQIEFVLEAAQRTLCGMDAGRRLGRNSLACVRGAEDTMPLKRGRAPQWRTASTEHVVKPPSTMTNASVHNDATTRGGNQVRPVCPHAPPARDMERAWQQEQRAAGGESAVMRGLVAAARAPPMAVDRMHTAAAVLVRSGKLGARALLHDDGFKTLEMMS